MKKVRENNQERSDGPPKPSKYALNRKARLMSPTEIVEELTKSVPPAFIPRDRGLRAVVPSFYSRDEFMFLTATDGEELFLSKQTINKSGFQLREGDIIHCDVKVVPDKKKRRVVFIHKVEHPRKP